jgi:uncharacterized protein YbaP (TraB family)
VIVRHTVIRRLRDGFALALSLLSPLLAVAQGSTPLIYEVRSETSTVYLFGTVHVGTRAMYPLSPQVEEAFAASGALALEANPLDQQEVAAAMAQAMYKAPDDLAKHVSPALFDQVKVLSPRVGLPIEYARRMKPHLLAMTLAMMEIQRLGYDAGLGLDVHFAQRAMQSGKPILELESMEGQMKLFDALPADLQEGMLQMAVDTIADGSVEKEMDALLKAWTVGDASAIHAIILRETEGLPEPVAQELRAAIYDRRNEAMAQQVAGYLAGQHPVFVAVGAGHLTGEDGIPELLKRRGFSVRRL